MPEGLKGKRVLLTGCTRGIGLGTARLLLKAGARVMGSGRDEARLARAAAELGALGDFQPLALAMEQPARAAEAARQAVEARWGALDILVNNAAAGGTFKSLPEGEPGELEELLAVNLIAPHRLTRVLLPLLLRGHEPTVLNVSSEAGQTSNLFKDRGGETYIFSKHSLNALTLLWARDLRGRVAVNAMHPGWISTDMGGPDAPEDLMAGGARVLQALRKPWSETGRFYYGTEEMAW